MLFSIRVTRPAPTTDNWECGIAFLLFAVWREADQAVDSRPACSLEAEEAAWECHPAVAAVCWVSAAFRASAAFWVSAAFWRSR
ncbi:hypothetical protein GCM10009533_11330 [Saccharopolyspora spinosporotrichia]|uniref:Uncharacterized protein n=1 Tax=Saccharopolyspora erythraea TaxID=1836 RepID=A0ABP3M8J2_SACER